jgi:NADH dehydrogenase
MAIIGRSHAIADFGRFTLIGFPAWLAWSLVHLMLLVDFRSRIVVYVNWSWAFFTYGRGARLLTGVSRLKRPQWPRAASRDARHQNAIDARNAPFGS